MSVKVFTRSLSQIKYFFAKITLNILGTESKPVTCISCWVAITKMTSHSRQWRQISIPNYCIFVKITLNIIGTESKQITCISCPVDITKITSHSRHRHCHSSTHRSQVSVPLLVLCVALTPKKVRTLRNNVLYGKCGIFIKSHCNMFPWYNQKIRHWFRYRRHSFSSNNNGLVH